MIFLTCLAIAFLVWLAAELIARGMKQPGRDPRKGVK